MDTPRLSLKNKRPGDIAYIDPSNEEVVLHKPSADSLLTHSGTENGLAWTLKTASGIDHGGLTGLADDDHTQYLKEKASGGVASEVPTHNHSAAGEAGTITSASVSDFTEAAQDAVGAMVAGSTYIDFVYTDATPQLQPSLKAATRDIPFSTTFTGTYSGGAALFPDETSATRYCVKIPVPATWDGSSDITVRTWWFAGAGATGNVDIETGIFRYTETDEDSITTVQAFTDTNLSWTTAQRTKILTTTIAAANIASGYFFSVEFIRNTGDANTGNIFVQGARVRAGVY